MSEDQEKIIEDLMGPLRVRYLQEMRVNLKELKNYASASRVRPLSDEDCSIIQHLAHKSLGSGKIFGFPKITEFGSLLEQQLIISPRPKDSVILSHLKKFIAVCETAGK